jgi:hypothetical protein
MRSSGAVVRIDLELSSLANVDPDGSFALSRPYFVSCPAYMRYSVLDPLSQSV